MVFSSILFIFIFLPLFLLIYHIVPTKAKNYIILAGSLFFYAWGAPRFIFLVIISLIINFYIVQKLYYSSNNKKLFLFLSIFLNLGLLAYFKYANFFIGNVNTLLNAINAGSVKWIEIALPIGISFFTFQSLTYTIDVYRKVTKPLKKLSDFILYILMFPQLIAGPIIRFNSIASEIIDRRHNETIDNKLMGIYRFIIGLAKKVLIANVLGEQVDFIYSLPVNEVGTSLAWIALIAYSFQIYYDFSGYSDMAIGLGKIIGFNFPENFNNPYVSKNITEFWKRWHITLSQWMRDYLYIPLGGNRVNTKSRLYFNLIIVFLLSGLWHGAAWNFVLWGAWHGLFLILDRLFLIKILKKIGKFPSILFSYLVITVGWLFFRIEDFNSIGIYLGKMFLPEQSSYWNFPDIKFWLILFIAVVFSFITIFKYGIRFENFIFFTEHKKSSHRILFIICLFLFFLSILSIIGSDFNPFIYFRF